MSDNGRYEKRDRSRAKEYPYVAFCDTSDYSVGDILEVYLLNAEVKKFVVTHIDADENRMEVEPC